jgi:hypothetical protein
MSAAKMGARMRVRVRAMTIAVAMSGGALLGVSCAGPSSVPPRTVSLRMAGSPAKATVTIDDQLVGELAYVANRGVALPPGVHHVTVSAPGYFPLDREIDAKISERPAPLRLDVKLVPIPD